MTNEQSAIARLRADLARADAEGTPVEANRDDLEAVIALAETGAALDKCLEIAFANNYEVAIMPYRDGTFVADFTDGKTDEYITHADGATSTEALAALESEAVNA